MAQPFVLAAKTIGTGHIARGTGCQDALSATIRADGVFVAALADGFGSCNRSADGAAAAVQTALATLNSAITGSAFPGEQRLDEVWSAVLSAAQDRVYDEIERAQDDYNEWKSTLLCAVAGDDWVSAMSVGDGFLIARFAGDDSVTLAIQPDRRGGGTITCSILSVDADERVQKCTHRRRPTLLFGSSDGLMATAVDRSYLAPQPTFVAHIDRLLERRSSLAESELARIFHK